MDYLTKLILKKVGQAPELRLSFSPRLNLFTGGNGLGKSFVLDVVWWALTTTWASEKALPSFGATASSIAATLKARGQEVSVSWLWEHTGEWVAELGTKIQPPTLVLYARADDSFAVYNSHTTTIHLTPAEVWDGQPTILNGLLKDWGRWRRANSPEFQALCKVMRELSPEEPLAPAGMERAWPLTYLLVWAWAEHEKASSACSNSPTQNIVLIIDEPELHLHPCKQRIILPAMLKAIGIMAPNASVQVFTATHSPLVLASLEPLFDPAQDALFSFRLMPRAHRVKVEKMTWQSHGDVSNWLTSVFNLNYAGSKEAEKSIAKALKLLDKPDLPDGEARNIHRELHEALGDTDPFWPRWLTYAQAKGIEP